MDERVQRVLCVEHPLDCVAVLRAHAPVLSDNLQKLVNAILEFAGQRSGHVSHSLLLASLREAAIAELPAASNGAVSPESRGRTVGNDFGWVDHVFSAEAGIWTLVGIAVVALVKTWPLILARINERKRDNVAERAGDWTRLRDEIDRLAARVEVLEQKVEECEAERDAAIRRAVTAETDLIKLEAYHLGIGEGKQQAQVILSTERKKGDAK